MSCALASPTDGVCANKRPVQGRRSPVAKVAVDQPRLTPLAQGHGRVDVERPAVAARQVAATDPSHEPFAADAPESTFSMAQLRSSDAAAQPDAVVDIAAGPRRTTPPSFREIRAGRAAAAGRTPVAEVRIPLAEVEHGTLLSDAHAHAPVASPAMPGMDQLVERVRRRTAARLGRSGSFSPA